MEPTISDVERDINDLLPAIVANSPLLAAIRRVHMRRSRVEIPRMILSEGSAPKVENLVLTTSRLTAPFTIGRDYWDETPEHERDKVIHSLLTAVASRDLEAALLFGDEASADNLLWWADGFITQTPKRTLLAESRRDITPRDIGVAFRDIPTKYRKDPTQFTVFCGERAASSLRTKGCPQHVVALEWMPENQFLLTHADNLVFGYEAMWKLRRVYEGPPSEEGEKSDVYHVAHFRFGCTVQVPEAAVVATLIPGP